jgi:ABC-type branched-subunit amino acid transport system substrate-binding protein
LPQLNLADKTIRVDVAAGSPGKYTFSICEPDSVTPETEEILDILKDEDGIEVIVVHSQYGKPGTVMTQFKDQLESKKFQLLAVVPPPFDDVYEYDIWMFETTFRNLFEGN